MGRCGGFRVLNRVGLGFYARRATSLRTFKVFFFFSKENNRISGGNRNFLQRQEIIRVQDLK